MFLRDWKRCSGILINSFDPKSICSRFTKSLNASLHDKLMNKDLIIFKCQTVGTARNKLLLIRNKFKQHKSYPSMRINALLLRFKTVNFSRPQNTVLFNISMRLTLKLISLISLHAWKRCCGILDKLFSFKLIVFTLTKSRNASLHDKINKDLPDCLTCNYHLLQIILTNINLTHQWGTVHFSWGSSRSTFQDPRIQSYSTFQCDSSSNWFLWLPYMFRKEL